MTNAGKAMSLEKARQIEILGQMISPPIELTLQTSSNRLRDMTIERQKSFPLTSAIEPGTTKTRLIKHSMDVRAPHKTVVPNSSIELFFVRSGRLVIVLTQDGMAANAKAGTFVHASRDAHMNLIPTNQALTFRKEVRGVCLYLCGLFLFRECCLRIQVA